MIPEIVGRDYDARAGDKTDPRDQTAAVDVVNSVIFMHAEAAEARQFEKGRIAVKQPVEALAWRQLSSGAEFCVGAGGGFPHLALEGAEFGDQLEMCDAIGAEVIASDDHF